MTALEPLACRIEGAMDGGTVVFIHGWPDDDSLWHEQVTALAGIARCVVITLPNFGASTEKRGGYNFPELVERLRVTIDNVRNDDETVTLITHDWGAYIGYMFEKAYPERVKKMVALDIGGHVQPKTAKSIGMMMGYQWTLICCWVIGGAIPVLGNWLTRRFARALRVPRHQATRVRSRFNYPYFYWWSGFLFPWARTNLLGCYKPQCPVLFIYGGEKPLMFHSERWLQTLEETGGRTVCIQNGGHWFMQTHPEQVNALIEPWLTPGQ